MTSLTDNEELLSGILNAYSAIGWCDTYPWCGVALHGATADTPRYLEAYHADLDTTVYVVFSTAGQLASAGLWARAQAAKGDIVLSVVIEEAGQSCVD